LVSGSSADAWARYYEAAFRKGLGETGYVEGQNVTVEYHWLEGHKQPPALQKRLGVRARHAAPGAIG
jgi:hypothetical protein